MRFDDNRILLAGGIRDSEDRASRRFTVSGAGHHETSETPLHTIAGYFAG